MQSVSNDARNPNCSHSVLEPAAVLLYASAPLLRAVGQLYQPSSPRTDITSYTEPLVRTGRPPRSQLDAEGKETSRICARLRLPTTWATEEYKVLPPAQWSNPASCHRHGWQLRLPNWTLDITPWWYNTKYALRCTTKSLVPVLPQILRSMI